MKEGDKNTKYFHARVTGRRKVNRISVLKSRTGDWCKNEEETCQEIIDYFQQIFTTQEPENFAEILEGVPQTITEEMNRELTRKVTEQEISKAVFSMYPHKSPGPYGMSPILFLKTSGQLLSPILFVQPTNFFILVTFSIHLIIF